MTDNPPHFRYEQPAAAPAITVVQTNGLTLEEQKAIAATQALIATPRNYLPIIDSRFANCGTCSLDIRRREGHGDVLAQIGPKYQPGGLMFVAEAPGQHEVRRRTPMVGDAGRIFDIILKTAGIVREECVVSNAVLCRSEDNKLDEASMAVECCNNRLIEELWSYKPRVVVALGNHAARALIGGIAIKVKAEEGPCIDCSGTGQCVLGKAKWLTERTR